MFPFLGAIGGALFGSSAATAATIGAAGSLASGILGARSAQKAVDRQNEYNDPANIRARAEAAGFNPLAFIGPGVGNQAAPAASGHMGAAVADASMLAADAISAQKREQGELAKLEQQNQQLQKQITQMTIRPQTAGVYGSSGALGLGNAGVVMTPEIPRAEPSVFPQMADTPDKDPKGAAASDEKYLAGTKPGTVMGFRWERSGLFGDGEWMETAYGDTPLNWPIAALSFASDVGYNAKGMTNWIGSKAYGTGPVMMIDGKAYQMRKPQAPKREEPKRRKDMFGTLGFR